MTTLSLSALMTVAAGGAIGAVLRYGTAVFAVRLFGAGFPIGTLLANVIGSLLMGALAVLVLERSGSDSFRLFLMTGLLGGFTTFSAFSLETLQLWQKGQLFTALVYVVLSVGLTLIAVAIGYRLAKGLI